MPEFIYGPKDGSEVPPMLWVLDSIQLVDYLIDGRKIIYSYEINMDDKNYYYSGEYEARGENE